MTRRAALMLAALEDGCTSRREFYAHAGRHYLTNNAASDLRRAGVEIAWDRETDTYQLLGERGWHGTPAAFVEETDGQLALEVAA